MNEEIRCITNEWKAAKNEWENDDSDFLLVLYSVYKKSGQFFFHTFFANLFKQRYISCYKLQIFEQGSTWKIKTLVLGFL